MKKVAITHSLLAVIALHSLRDVVAFTVRIAQAQMSTFSKQDLLDYTAQNPSVVFRMAGPRCRMN